MDVFSGVLTFVRTENPFRKPDGLPQQIDHVLEHANLEAFVQAIYEHMEKGYVFVGMGGQIEQKIALT